jgi:hypothetical protein
MLTSRAPSFVIFKNYGWSEDDAHFDGFSLLYKLGKFGMIDNGIALGSYQLIVASFDIPFSDAIPAIVRNQIMDGLIALA